MDILPVSVIIPHFNRVDLLRETLASIAAQTVPVQEVIIVDDGSDAGEYARLCEWASERITIIQREKEPKGPSSCRNLGIARAKAKYIFFLDSDDLLSPSALEERFSCAEKATENDFWVFPYTTFFRQPGDTPYSVRFSGSAEAHLHRFLLLRGVWCVSSALWRADSLRALGGFNPEIWYGDDAELHIHALLEGLRFREYPDTEPGIFVRRGVEARATNSLPPSMIRSRLIYLQQVSELIDRYPRAERNHRLWNTAYFAEAEFLLFKGAHQSIIPVLHDMKLLIAGWEYRALMLYFALARLLYPRLSLLFRIWRKCYSWSPLRRYFSWNQRWSDALPLPLLQE